MGVLHNLFQNQWTSSSLKLIIFSVVLHTQINTQAYAKESFTVQAGDLIFQSSAHNPLTDAIEGSTESPFSHVGILVPSNGQLVVRQAADKVEDTPILKFLSQGRDGKVAVYRLKKEYQSQIPLLIQKTKNYLGKPYDYQFRLNDEPIYCSELIYRAFNETTGESLGKTVQLKDLKWQKYEETIKKFGDGIVPLKREIITPKDLADATQLELVFSNY